MTEMTSEAAALVNWYEAYDIEELLSLIGTIAAAYSTDDGDRTYIVGLPQVGGLP